MELNNRQFLKPLLTWCMLLAVLKQFKYQATNRLLLAALEEYGDSGTTQKKDVKKTLAKMLPSTLSKHCMCTISKSGHSKKLPIIVQNISLPHERQPNFLPLQFTQLLFLQCNATKTWCDWLPPVHFVLAVTCRICDHSVYSVGLPSESQSCLPKTTDKKWPPILEFGCRSMPQTHSIFDVKFSKVCVIGTMWTCRNYRNQYEIFGQ